LEKVLVQRQVLLEPEPLTLAEKLRGVGPRPRIINPNKAVKILVCGPEGMINTLAGPRPRQDEQAKIGGILGELGFGPEHVHRL